MFIDVVKSGGLATGVEAMLYQSAGAFCPPKKDGSGIARVDGAGIPVLPPSSIYMTTSFSPMPTHTWLVWGMFQGQHGMDTCHLLSNVLPVTIAAGLAQLLAQYEMEELKQSGGSLDDSADALSAFTGGFPSHGGQEEMEMPFTPDIVRPYPPSSVIDDLIRDAFTHLDDFITWTRLETFLGRVGASSLLTKPLSAFDQTSNSTGSQDSGVPEPSASPRQLAAHTLSDARYGSSALVGLYESDTKVVKMALCGDGRALLGRPVSNGAYRPPAQPSARKAPSQAPEDTPTTPLKSRQKRDFATLYETTVITADQTPSNTAERRRIAEEHPDLHQKLFMPAPGVDGGEKETYMGIGTTRGFGYAFLKWPLHIQKWMRQHCLGEDLPTFFEDGRIPGPSVPADASKQRAYLTAEPEITTLTVAPGEFLVIGSKGLWECLSNEEVVGLVGTWLEERRQLLGDDGGSVNAARDRAPERVRGHNAPESSIRDPATLLGTSGAFGGGGISGAIGLYELSMNPKSQPLGGPARLIDPAELPISSTSSSKTGRPPWRWNQWNPSSSSFGDSKVQKRTFILDPQDLSKSASAHILRNALGGANFDLTSGLLNKTDKKWRSDLAVQVIFFE
ncbi:phosphatase 2C-like domain-containing protein [Coprinopsis sp. MPI-PUGE-AT-0042]|nr:phosphatase 2C-like domain-containing protein [Coprinopsis sp. MPI-PUGE-AT-0042]